MQKRPKNAKTAQNCKKRQKSLKQKKLKIDPWSPPMISTDHKIYEKTPKNTKKTKMGHKTQKRTITGKNGEKKHFFTFFPSKYFNSNIFRKGSSRSFWQGMTLERVFFAPRVHLGPLCAMLFYGLKTG